MRITLNIDDDVVAAAKRMVAERGVTVDQAISGVRNGFPVLPKSGRIVTPELVEKLLEEADLADAGLLRGDR